MTNKPPYVTVDHGLRGWFAVLVVWNEEGFYEPWNSGVGSYPTSNDPELLAEGQWWADDEGIKFFPLSKDLN